MRICAEYLSIEPHRRTIIPVESALLTLTMVLNARALYGLDQHIASQYASKGGTRQRRLHRLIRFRLHHERRRHMDAENAKKA